MMTKIVGRLLILPLNITVHGVSFKMGGIGFVATYPEYRQQGIIKRLMTEAPQKCETMDKRFQY